MRVPLEGYNLAHRKTTNNENDFARSKLAAIMISGSNRPTYGTEQEPMHQKRNVILGLSSIIAVLFIRLSLTSCANQSPPSIKHGEFPFYLKYEMHGKIYEIRDTVICDFSGYDISGGFGKYRSWEEHLKSGRDRFSIILKENEASVLKPGRINRRSELYFNYGEAQYYMGDPNAKSALHAKPNFCYVETYDETPNTTNIDATNLTSKQLQMYFGIVSRQVV
jgi:hypothetical protein